MLRFRLCSLFRKNNVKIFRPMCFRHWVQNAQAEVGWDHKNEEVKELTESIWCWNETKPSRKMMHTAAIQNLKQMLILWNFFLFRFPESFNYFNSHSSAFIWEVIWLFIATYCNVSQTWVTPSLLPILLYFP